MGRREVTSAITMLVLVGLLVLGTVWGWRALFAEIPEPDVALDEPQPTCRTAQIQPGQRLRTDQVQVSVFNSGTRSGLAGQTLDALLDRGFLSGDIGNAPVDVDIDRVEVWTTVENDDRARLVAWQFGRRVPVRVSEEDLGPGIDVIVGNAFQKMPQGPQEVRVRQAQEFCLPLEPTEQLD